MSPAERLASAAPIPPGVGITLERTEAAVFTKTSCAESRSTPPGETRRSEREGVQQFGSKGSAEELQSLAPKARNAPETGESAAHTGHDLGAQLGHGQDDDDTHDDRDDDRENEAAVRSRFVELARVQVVF
jgi:hypothetical protein